MAPARYTPGGLGKKRIGKLEVVVRRLSALVAIALTGASAPAATRTFNSFDGTSGNFGNTRVAPGRFADKFTVTLDADGEFSATIYSAADGTGTDLDLTDVRLTGPKGVDLGFTTVNSGAEEYRVFNSQVLPPGTYTLSVQGRGGPAARYSGNITFVQIGRIPEPATWLMMFLGFGSLGFVIRRRKPGASRIRFH